MKEIVYIFIMSSVNFYWNILYLFINLSLDIIFVFSNSLFISNILCKLDFEIVWEVFGEKIEFFIITI